MISLSILVVLVGVFSAMTRKTHYGALLSLQTVVFGLISFFFYVGQSNFKEYGHVLAWLIFIVCGLLMVLGYAFVAKIIQLEEKNDS